MAYFQTKDGSLEESIRKEHVDDQGWRKTCWGSKET